MYRKEIAISFVILFMSLIMAPSAIAIFNDSIDTSVFYSLNEEEEENHTPKIIPLFPFLNTDALADMGIQNLRGFDYQFKNYPKPHLNLISPPPESIL